MSWVTRPLLEALGLTKSFGGVEALKNLSFNLNTKEIVGLIGPNGAGKTTVFNLLTGVYPPDRGKIYFSGQSIAGWPPDAIVRAGIARTFQNIRLFRNLSALDNVITALDLRQPLYNLAEGLLRPPFFRGKVRYSEEILKKKAMSFLHLVEMEALAKCRADSLPYGHQRKLEIARALALSPKLLLLDEPAAGMNPEETRELGRLIRRLKESLDLTILLIEHHMELVMELCDRIYVINFGKELAVGSPEEIQQNPAVLKAYLGEAKRGWEQEKSF